METTLYELYTDGGARPNPGNAGYGAALFHNGTVMSTCLGYLGDPITNNIAEYSGVLAGIEMFLKTNVDTPGKLVIKSDSNLLVNQLNGIFAVRAAGLGPFHAAILGKLELLKNIMPVTIEHVKAHVGIPGNELADALASQAIDERSECDPSVLHYLGQSKGKSEILEKGHEKLEGLVKESFIHPVIPTKLDFSSEERAGFYRQDNKTDKLLLHFPPLVLMEPENTTLLVLATGFKKQGADPAVRTMDLDAYKAAYRLATAGARVTLVHRPHAGGRWLNASELKWPAHNPMTVFCPIRDLFLGEEYSQDGWPTFVGVSGKWVPL